MSNKLFKIPLFLLIAFSLINCLDEEKEFECDENGQCPIAGYVCVDGKCIKGTTGTNTQNSIGSSGGTIVGTDGVTLSVPAGALTDSIEFTIVRQSTTIKTIGFTPISRVYEIKPAGTTFSSAASISIPYSSTKIPSGYSASDVSIWRTNNLANPYEPIEKGTTEAGKATGLTTTLSYFAAGVILSSGDDGGPPDDGGPQGDVPTIPMGDPGPSFLRDCTHDLNLCDDKEPVCYQLITGEKVCTGTCQYMSDCPLDTCCWDTQGDNNPETTYCLPMDGCTALDPTLPSHRSCTTDLDCPRGGTCIFGRCFRTIGSGNGIADTPCESPTDCDLNLTDHCLHRMPTGAWRAGEKIENSGAVHSVCASRCDGSNACPAGMCCRLATVEGNLPLGFCVSSEGDEGANNCNTVTDIYQNCYWSNPTTCDPAASSNCILFEFAEAQGQYCSLECILPAQCGGGSCCKLDTYGVAYCISGLSACPCISNDDCITGSCCPDDGTSNCADQVEPCHCKASCQ